MFRLRTVPADASMTIKFASQSVIVIHCVSLAPISFVPGITVSQSIFHPYMNLIITMSNLHHGIEALCILREDNGLCIAIPVDDIEAYAAGENVPSY